MANSQAASTVSQQWADHETETILLYFINNKSEIGNAGNFKKKIYTAAARTIPGQTRSSLQVQTKWQAMSSIIVLFELIIKKKKKKVAQEKEENLYKAGTPLLGSPGIPLHPPSPCRQPHIPFEWGGGDWVGVGMGCTFFIVAGRPQ
ncbi:hypothetical protein L208DRAFT_1399357 [Tricholoma matsutake]|nr:hypothetical protein L208DRAFT_1399357 [Tricholoma matsutake 945]